VDPENPSEPYLPGAERQIDMTLRAGAKTGSRFVLKKAGRDFLAGLRIGEVIHDASRAAWSPRTHGERLPGMLSLRLL